MAILGDHGLHATFYINSGFIGDADHMSWVQVRALEAGGNEIGGHTIFHTNVKKLKLESRHARDLRRPRRRSPSRSSTAPVSFAYPFGSFNARAKSVVASCGYTSGRGVSGVTDRKVFAETIPPLDPYATRTPPNPKQGTTLDDDRGLRDRGRGQRRRLGAAGVPPRLRPVRRVLDHAGEPRGAGSTWLAPRAANGTVVMTTAQVMASRVGLRRRRRCRSPPSCAAPDPSRRGPPPSRGGPRRCARRPTAPASRRP